MITAEGILQTSELQFDGTQKAGIVSVMEKYAEQYKQEIERLKKLLNGQHNAHFLEQKIGGERYQEIVKKGNEIGEQLANLVFLHSCEQEGLSSGKPTPMQWITAVEGAADILYKYSIEVKPLEKDFGV